MNYYEFKETYDKFKQTGKSIDEENQDCLYQFCSTVIEYGPLVSNMRNEDLLNAAEELLENLNGLMTSVVEEWKEENPDEIERD